MKCTLAGLLRALLLVAALWPSCLYAVDLSKAKSEPYETYYDDASPQFNEQGFFKGSSFSNVGEAMVNNFNGNLIYNRNLFTFEGEGNLDVNVSLTYNGSVSHSMIMSWRSYYTGEVVNNLSFNSPEWILGVNGVGVQLFNFENEMYSWFAYNGPLDWWDAVRRSLRRDSVAMIVGGYHFNVDQRDGTWFPRSSMSYMLADGSANTVFNDKEVNGATVYDEGYCQGDHVKDRTKGWSELKLSNPLQKEYWIKPGDGTTIYGRTRREPFKTGYQQDCTGHPAYMRWYDTIGVFIPDSIYDARGNVITLTYTETYEGTNPVYGRPLLTRIELNHDPNRRINIDYHISNGTVTAITIGDYELAIKNRPDGSTLPSLSGNNNRGYITKITDPQGRETSFDYERYVRGIYNIPHFSFRGNVSNCTFTHLTPDSLYPDFYRIAEIADYTGGVHRFKYFNFDNGLDSLDNWKYQSNHWQEFPHDRYPAYFDSTGRDAFFTNMVTSASAYTSKGITEELIVKDSFEYAWYHPYSRHEYMDSLFTYKYTDSTANPKPNGAKVRYAYAMYPYSDETHDCSDGTCYELSWQVCLLQEANEYDTTTYFYDVGSCQLTVPPPSPGCSGTLKLTKKRINKAGRSHAIEYDYQLAADGFNYRADTVFMPLGIKQVTTYAETFHPVVDSTSYYFSALPASDEKRRQSNNQLLSSRTMTYYTTNGSTGYKGQLWKVSDNLVEDGSISQANTTTLKYWTNADEGYGNLRSVIGPAGDSVSLFFDLGDTTIGGRPANLLFNVVDTRLGERPSGEYVSNYKGKFALLEKYVRKTGGYDTLTQYRAYDKYGLVTRLVDASDNLSVYEYDDAHRIARMLLPGSFDTLITTHTVVTPQDYSGYANEYHYDDTAGDGSYTHATITTRLELLDTVCIVSDSLPETITLQSRIVGSGSVVNFDSVDYDQTINYTLDVPYSSECGSSSYARIYRNDQLIDQLVCGGATTHLTGTFQAYADDSITAKAYSTSPETDVITRAVCYLERQIPPVDTFTVAAEVTGIGNDTAYYFIPTNQTVDYGLRIIVLPIGSCNDIYARIYRGSVLINEVNCNSSNKNITGSFAAAAGDSITVVAHSSMIVLETIVRADFDYYVEADGIDTVDCFLEQRTRHEFDGLLRLTETDFIHGDGSYDYLVNKFDYAGAPTGTIDQLGYETNIAYDKIGREVERVFPDSAQSTTERSYGSAWLSSLPSAVTQLVTLSDPYLETVAVTDENGGIVTEYRDAHAQRRFIEQTLDGRDIWTAFDYDDLGHLTKVIRPEGDFVRYEYNSLGQVVREWSSDYDTLLYRYDRAGRKTAYRDGTMDYSTGGSDSTQVNYAHVFSDGEGFEYTEMTIAQNGSVSYVLEIEHSNAHPGTVSRIKKNGSLVASISGCTNCAESGSIAVVTGDVVRLEVDIQAVHDPGGMPSATARHFIPALGRGDWMYYTYDDLGRMTSSGLAEACVFEYEGVPWWGDLSGYTPINFYYYDQPNSENSRGRLSLTFTNNLGHSYGEKFDYDAAGRLARKTVYYGATRDSALIPGCATYQYSLSGTQYVTDMSSNMAGAVKSVAYPYSTLHVEYNYDDRGRLEYVGDPLIKDRYATLSYSARDELTQMRLGLNAQVVDYEYNARGWLNSINNGTVSSLFGGDRFGERLYYYDHPSYSGWSGQFNGNVMAQKVAFAGDQDVVYHYLYDDLDRLTDVSRIYPSSGELPFEEFAYDDNGNRTQYYYYHPTTGTEYFYAAGSNILDSIKIGSTRKSLTWNELGALTHDDRHGGNYLYDEYSQLEWVQWPSSAGTNYLHFDYGVDGDRVAKTYKYYYWSLCCNDPVPEPIRDPVRVIDPNDDDPDGELQSIENPRKTVDQTSQEIDELTLPEGDEAVGLDDSQPGGDCYSCVKNSTSWTRYINGLGQVLAEFRNSATTPKYQFIYAGNRRIAMLDGSTLYFLVSDHLGSTRAIVDQSGNVKDRYEYFAYGSADTTTTTTNQPYRYTGKPVDPERGFDTYFFGARYYDPRLGRFTSIDPEAVKFPNTTPYTYGADNPLTMVDPDGNEVYFYGPDAEKAAKELDKASSLDIKFDKKTGQVTAEGEAKTDADKKLKEAIEDKNVKVKVTTTKKDYFKSQDGSTQPIRTGTFDGSQTAADGKIETSQVVNLGHAKKDAKAGGGSVGQTVLHETNESYIGAIQSPGQPYTDGPSGTFQQAHNATLRIDPPQGAVQWKPKSIDTKGFGTWEIVGPKGTVTIKTKGPK